MPSPESIRLRKTLVKSDPHTAPPIEVQRQEWEAGALQATLPPQTTVETVNVNGIHAEWVRCGAIDPKKALLYWHGGGFSTGSCITHRELAARLSQTGGVSVLLFDYRLAPEYPFPAAVEDSVTIYRWLLAQGFDPQAVCLAGDSAGGHVVLAALLDWRTKGLPLPSGAILLSPWLDLSLTGATITTNAERDPMVTAEDLAHAAQLYIGTADPQHPLLTPLAADLSGLPPMLIHVGGDEVLLSDSIRLAERARAVGVQVELHIWEGLWHVFPAWAGGLPEGQAALEEAGALLQRL